MVKLQKYRKLLIICLISSLGSNTGLAQAGTVSWISGIFKQTSATIGAHLQQRSNAARVVAIGGLALATYGAAKAAQAGYQYYQLRHPAPAARTTETTATTSAIIPTDLLALDETGGKRLMEEIYAELNDVKEYFEAEPEAKDHKTMYIDENHAPTLVSLVASVANKIQLTQLEKIETCLGLRGGWEKHCSAELHVADDKYELNLGYQAIINSSYAELVALLGHELGHIKQQHSKKRLCFSQGADAAILMLAGHRIYQQPTLYGGAKAGLTALAVLVPAMFIERYLQRQNEFEADKIAYKVVQQPEPLITFIKKGTERKFRDADEKAERARWLSEHGRRTGLETHPTTACRQAYLQELHAKRLTDTRL